MQDVVEAIDRTSVFVETDVSAGGDMMLICARLLPPSLPETLRGRT